MKCSKAAFGEQNKKSVFYSVLGILHAVGGGLECLVFSERSRGELLFSV